jgi:hypothetical protein
MFYYNLKFVKSVSHIPRPYLDKQLNLQLTVYMLIVISTYVKYMDLFGLTYLSLSGGIRCFVRLFGKEIN